MDWPIIIGVGVGIVAIIAIILIATYYYEKKRTESFAEAAENMGLSFEPAGDPSLIVTLGSFQLFQSGRSKRVKNMIFGDSGDVSLGVFDYQYTTGHGKHSKTTSQTVLYVESKILRSPDFALCPKNFFHSIAGLFGYQDINFDSHVVFSSNYLLRGSNEDAIRQIFQQPVLDFFESNLGLTVEASDGHLLFFRAGRRINADEISQLMSDGLQVHSVLCGDPVK